MRSNSPRRFSIFDAMVLVAATAVALFVLRHAHAVRTPSPGAQRIQVWTVGLEVAPFLVTGAAALLILVARRPRTEAGHRYGRPGAVACIVFLATLLLESLSMAAREFSGPLTGKIIYFPFDTHLINAPYNGNVVASAWGALILAGCWRPEPTWIDRAGRVLGGLLILLWLGILLDL